MSLVINERTCMSCGYPVQQCVCNNNSELPVLEMPGEGFVGEPEFFNPLLGSGDVTNALHCDQPPKEERSEAVPRDLPVLAMPGETLV